jgi:glycosyltransferase involved in cell wall biosynthesis
MLDVDAAPRPLVIGIDARAASEVKAGRGRVVRELLRALAGRPEPHRYICYAREPWEQELDRRFEWTSIRARDPVWHVRVASAAGRECDVFLSSNSYLTVLLLRIPSVAIVYDLVTFDPAMRPNRRSMVIERLTLGATVRRAARLLCISGATANDLVKRFPGSQRKIKLAPLGVAPELLRGRVDCAGLPQPGFVLAVGTLEPRKNLPRLIEAYASLPAPMQAAHPLVVVGAQGWQTGETLAAMRRLGDSCIALGHVTDAVLSELYRRCAIFCYPSLGEGFGLPVLEAMAAGAPVLTSNLSSLPEVGGEAVEYVDPRSVGSIAAGLDRLLASPARRKELSELARRRAASFSWQLTAERTLEALREAVA